MDPQFASYVFTSNLLRMVPQNKTYSLFCFPSHGGFTTGKKPSSANLGDWAIPELVAWAGSWTRSLRWGSSSHLLEKSKSNNVKTPHVPHSNPLLYYSFPINHDIPMIIIWEVVCSVAVSLHLVVCSAGRTLVTVILLGSE